MRHAQDSEQSIAEASQPPTAQLSAARAENPDIVDMIVVMGRTMRWSGAVKEGARDVVFDNPKEPYTRKLLSAIPALDQKDNGGVMLKWRLEA